ncbi:MAG: murein transglycosylase domain-containing protein, partial [Pseudomonadota bacterium]|nr:murein transglycosylase domain-containing protein [Pseudomonadota bacterium]
MNKQAKTITALVVLCGLLVLSTGYVVQLQSWLVFNLNIENSKQKQLVTGVSGYTGIRTLVSSEELVTYSAKEAGTSQLDHKLVAVVKTPTPVLNQVFNPPASNLLATGTVLPKDRIDTSESLAIEPKTIEQTWSSKVFNQQKEFPLVVELDDEVIIEFSENYSRLEMQKAISRLLVLSNSIDAEQILSSKAIDTHQKPYLYKRVFNEYAKPIRYPAQAFRYAELLINNHAQQIHDEQGVYTVVSIPLTEQQLPTPVETYRAWVNQYAQQHQVSPELVFAIMDVESAFNPRAVSQSNALG